MISGHLLTLNYLVIIWVCIFQEKFVRSFKSKNLEIASVAIPLGIGWMPNDKYRRSYKDLCWLNFAAGKQTRQLICTFSKKTCDFQTLGYHTLCCFSNHRFQALWAVKLIQQIATNLNCGCMLQRFYWFFKHPVNCDVVNRNVLTFSFLIDLIISSFVMCGLVLWRKNWRRQAFQFWKRFPTITWRENRRYIQDKLKVKVMSNHRIYIVCITMCLFTCSYFLISKHWRGQDIFCGKEFAITWSGYRRYIGLVLSRWPHDLIQKIDFPPFIDICLFQEFW